MTSIITTEIWKSVPGWPDYEASNLGKLKRKSSGRILKGHRFRLKHESKKVQLRIATIILLTFVGPAPKGKPLACHLDDNHNHNKLTNLAWGSYRDNALDAIRNGKQVYTKARSRKISISKKGKPLSDATRKANIAWRKSTPFSATHRVALSKAIKKMWAKRKGKAQCLS